MPPQRVDRLSSNFMVWRAASAKLPQSPVYVMNWTSLAWAGLAAAVAITFYMMIVPRLLGVEQMDIGITIGLMADPSDGAAAYLARLGWHLGNGIAYVPFYALILLWLQRQSNAWTGVLFGVFLWLAGPMLLVPILLNLKPLGWSDGLSHPGIFMFALGLGWTPAVIDLVAHLTHGVVAGVICKHRLSDDA